MKNTFGWMQLQSSSVEEAHTFYEKLFAWKVEHKGMEDDESYTEIDAGEGPCAGISVAENVPSMWLPFVNVDNVQTYTQRAEELGAHILTEPLEIAEGMGWYSVLQDPTGAIIGLYQPPSGS